ncbi:MAG: PhzF family phenazine biosynthesis protein [Gammaproteobacteria bacterium]|nr:PhzF family phenazine biosynthesis protein [Gammaproteobacteria bacterium]
MFLLDGDLPASTMQRITWEMRQFETIFLTRMGNTSRFGTRIFTMEEELLFAGHPIIGAAALMHAELFAGDPVAQLGSGRLCMQQLASIYRYPCILDSPQN